MTQHLPTDLPDLTGRIALVTGATSGLGLAAVERLAAAGAETILGVRDEAKARRVVAGLRERVPHGAFRVEVVDVADLASVRACAERVRDQGRPLDLLVNNAGVMTGRRTPEVSVDGFELHHATNFLGAFALTGLLLPSLRLAYAPRVVGVGSLTSHQGRLPRRTRYSPGAAYADSKLALTAFARELQRRSDAYGWGLTSTAAHPGWTATNLNGGRFNRIGSRLPILVQLERGVLPVLVAATRPEVPGGSLVGPADRLQLTGEPALVSAPKRARDAAAAARLWQVAEQESGVVWPAA